MAQPTRITEPTIPQASLQTVFDLPMAMTASLLQAQRIQLDALVSWQASSRALAQDMWDQWACRWAGGVPIDG